MKKKVQSKNKRQFIKILFVSIIICFATSAFGSIFTTKAVNSDWYLSIKPSITPPNYLFGPVWTILYFLIAVSLAISWISAKKQQKNKIAFVFGANLILNAVWSLFFFGMKNPTLAFVDIIAVWLTIILAIAITYKINKKSAYLLIPYLLWVSFASILNFLAI